MIRVSRGSAVVITRARVRALVAAILGRPGRWLTQLSEVVGVGPRRYRQIRSTRSRAERRIGSTFANEVTTTLTAERSAAWYAFHAKPLVVAVYGGDGDARTWAAQVRRQMRVEIVIAGGAGRGFDPVDAPDGLIGARDADSADVTLTDVIDWMHAHRRRWDLLLVDLREPLPDPASMIQLQHAAHEYHHDREVGIVTPAFAHPGGIVPGFDYDHLDHAFVAATSARSYGQEVIPRYVLTAPAHGLYVTSEALDRIDAPPQALEVGDPDAQAQALVMRAWMSGYRVLCWTPTVWGVRAAPSLSTSEAHRSWLSARLIEHRDGRPRIVFVLNATSISGGIRIVFETAVGLAARGFDVEIWTLQGEPDWFDLGVPVRSFRTYGDLLLALRRIDSIKVATWWETAEIVWLASANRGVPAYLIQEFETWFYPDDPVGQAAVVASYRREFRSVTEASYQRRELAEVGVRAALIPNGYDDTTFRLLDGFRREADSVLALGRSFFQKNFAMTERAWRSLGDERPNLLLFGNEPEIIVDERVHYHVRPTDAEVNELYNTATLFVQTSRHEGFCLPILEAMAAGCPVITTDSHGNRDFCEDGVNCVIVPQDDDAALAAAITRLLADPGARDRLRAGGLRTARAYRWPAVLDRVAEHYRGMLAIDRAESVTREGAP